TRTIIPNGNANQGDQAVGLQFGKRLRAQAIKGGAIDEVRVFRTAMTPLEIRFLHQQSLPSVTGAEIADLLVAVDPGVTAALTSLTSARNAENELVSVVPEVMIFRDLPTPRPTYALVRGNYDDHGDRVA